MDRLTLARVVVLAFLCASFGCFYAAKRMN